MRHTLANRRRVSLERRAGGILLVIEEPLRPNSAAAARWIERTPRALERALDGRRVNLPPRELHRRLHPAGSPTLLRTIEQLARPTPQELSTICRREGLT